MNDYKKPLEFSLKTLHSLTRHLFIFFFKMTKNQMFIFQGILIFLKKATPVLSVHKVIKLNLCLIHNFINI